MSTELHEAGYGVRRKVEDRGPELTGILHFSKDLVLFGIILEMEDSHNYYNFCNTGYYGYIAPPTTG